MSPIGDGENPSPSGEEKFGEMAADSAATSQKVLNVCSLSHLQDNNDRSGEIAPAIEQRQCARKITRLTADGCSSVHSAFPLVVSNSVRILSRREVLDSCRQARRGPLLNQAKLIGPSIWRSRHPSEMARATQNRLGHSSTCQVFRIPVREAMRQRPWLASSVDEQTFSA